MNDITKEDLNERPVYRVGDVVVSTESDQPMTVIKVDDAQEWIGCAWFYKNAQVRETFRWHELRPASRS